MGDYNHQQMSNQHHQQIQQKQYVPQQHHQQQHMQQQQQQHYHQNIQQRTVQQMPQGQRPPIRPHMNTPQQQQQNNPNMQSRINTPMQNQQQGYRINSMQQQSSQPHQGTPQPIRQINQNPQIGQGGTVYVTQNPNSQQRIIHRQMPAGTVMRTVQTSSQYANNQQMSTNPQQQQQAHYIYSNESPNRLTQGNQRVIHQQGSNNQTGVSALRQALGHPSGSQNAHQGPTLVQYSANPQPPQHPSQPPTPQQQMTIRSHTPQPQIKIDQQSPQQTRSSIVVTSPASITSPYNNITNSQQRMTPLVGQGRISPVEPQLVIQKETPKQLTPAPVHPENYDNVPIMTKDGLKEFVKTIDETDIVEEDVLDNLIESSNELVENVLEKAKKLALHRGGNKIEARDIEMVLKKFYDIDVPPYIAGVYLTQ
ncbi:Transcription initiation factor TFIID domain and Histone-fold domain-containing protein [Strongyloides ratti]|uniref:Transcription initiation factor TFIID subunit 12 n=1 Tax=Strongyloides ratti TaxID=34506 RepID=A0A090LP62_STRRB|nr:Transcription initiation factor TFIID domain and Histone-fold domain-containing protein [Strongyloides ratti]CEF69295.1 Transcription initiation factor TFIID domain and Histone-fold domain-containing protein [Strongyloides ratti]